MSITHSTLALRVWASGKTHFSYDDKPVAAASLRAGITDDLTLEAHGEAGSELVNGGIGGILSLGRFGMLEGAASASQFDGSNGLQSTPPMIRNSPASISASARQDSLATMRISPSQSIQSRSRLMEIMKTLARGARWIRSPQALPLRKTGAALDLAPSTSRKPMAGVPITCHRASTAPAQQCVIVPDGLCRDGQRKHRRRQYRFLGAAWQLGIWQRQRELDRDSTSFNVAAAKPRGHDSGSLGWRAQVQSGEEIAAKGDLSFRTRYADLGLGASVQGKKLQANAYADGAIVMADGGVFASRRIDDAFAIVDAGLPDVEVLLQNQSAGRTGASGKLLVRFFFPMRKTSCPSLSRTLPLGAEVTENERLAIPSSGSGILVDFGVKTDTRSALVEFRDASGAYVPPAPREA